MRDSGQISILEIMRAKKRNRTGTKSLHRKREVSQARMRSESFASNAQRSHIECLMLPAVLSGHCVTQPSCAAQEFYVSSANLVDLLLLPRFARLPVILTFP